MKKLPDHELAGIFPMAEAEDRATLAESIKANGQLEEVITLDGKVLDGRNRQDIIIDELGQVPDYLDYMNLPMHLRGASPLEFVMAKNGARRHLTKGQKAMAAAAALPFFEALAKERQLANLKQNAPSRSKNRNGDDGVNQDDGTRPEDESQAPKKGSAKGTSAAAAGAAFGVSETSVRKAKKLLKTNPELAEKVKSKKTTLSKASRTADKEAKEAEKLANAIKRITTICGKDIAAAMADGAILKSAKERLALAELDDDDMQKIKGLIGLGWKVAKAARVRMTRLSRTHSIGDLCLRALAANVANKGSFVVQITHEDVPLEITVRRAPAAA